MSGLLIHPQHIGLADLSPVAMFQPRMDGLGKQQLTKEPTLSSTLMPEE